MTVGARALLAAALAALAPPAPAKEIDCGALLVHIRSLTGLLERVELLEKAIEGCPGDGGIAYERAYAMERLRRYPVALAGYRAAAELDPGNAKAHFGLGEMLLRHGDPVGAEAAFDRGLALDPKAARIRKPLELARIGARAQRGEEVAAAEIVRVLTEAELKPGAPEGTDGPRIRWPIAFKGTSSKVDDALAARLAPLGEALKTGPLAAARMELSVHVDEPGKKPEATVALTHARAEAIRDHFVARHGLSPERFTVKGFGASRPITPDATPESRRQGRRLELRWIQ